MNACRSPIVFAISAIPGGGKTSLTRRLKNSFETAIFLAHDDFATATSWSLDKITAWFERGGDFNEFDCSALVEELYRALQEKPAPTPLFLETHFGRQHRALGPLIDKLIWIDVPPDIALARQVRDFTQRALRQDHGHVDYLTWQQTYIDYYLRDLQRMYRQQQAVILPSADLVVDGRATPDDIAGEVSAFVTRTLLA